MESLEKFTGKAAKYGKFRPSYPSDFINYLTMELGMSADAAVADVGAGTGILTRQVSYRAGTVYAVEPNPEMRAVCRQYCSDLNNVNIVDGTAEKTGLPDRSVDLITVGQAFHWFDKNLCKTEFRRILKPGGKVVLVWNSRKNVGIMARENEVICKRFCPAFKGFSGGPSSDPAVFADFFKDGVFDHRNFENDRSMTMEAFIGYSLSSSYAPSEGDANYQGFINGLTGLFNKHGRGGRLIFFMQADSFAGEM